MDKKMELAQDDFAENEIDDISEFLKNQIPKKNWIFINSNIIKASELIINENFDIIRIFISNLWRLQYIYFSHSIFSFLIHNFRISCNSVDFKYYYYRKKL